MQARFGQRRGRACWPRPGRAFTFQSDREGDRGQVNPVNPSSDSRIIAVRVKVRTT